MDGATLLKQIGFKVFINSILHNRLTENDLCSLYKEIKERGFNRWRVDTPFNQGNWPTTKDDFGLSLEDAFKYFNLILEMWLQDNKPFEIEIDHTLKYLNGKFFFLDKYSLDDPVCPCKIFSIWSNGSITWCQDLHGQQFIIGNIYDDIDILYSQYKPFKETTINDVLQRVSQCRNCGYLNNCAIGCRANSILQSGGYFDKDNELCGIYMGGLYKTISETLIRHNNRNLSDVGVE